MSQHVGGLAAEVLSLVDPDAVADSVGDDSPLAKAKTPQELALLVKHYRLLEVFVPEIAESTTLFQCHAKLVVNTFDADFCPP